MTDKTLDVRTPVKSVVLTLRTSNRTQLYANLARLGRGVLARTPCTSLAFGCGDLTQCRLVVDDQSCALWVNGAAFDVARSEVRAIATTFGIPLEVVDTSEEQEVTP